MYKSSRFLQIMSHLLVFSRKRVFCNCTKNDVGQKKTEDQLKSHWPNSCSVVLSKQSYTAQMTSNSETMHCNQRMEAIALTSNGSNLVQNFLRNELKRRFFDVSWTASGIPRLQSPGLIFLGCGQVKSLWRKVEQAVYEPRRIEGKNKSRLERYR